MGHLTYAGATVYDIEDRMLAHLALVIGQKLRRQEPFMLSWEIDNRNGAGRAMLWIAPGIPLELRFSGSRQPELSHRWVETMLEMSGSPQGLRLVSEAEALAIHERVHSDRQL